MANAGPMPQADLLAIYRRLFAATRALEATDRRRVGADVVAAAGSEPVAAAEPRAEAAPEAGHD
jgi:hypothetical protein